MRYALVLLLPLLAACAANTPPPRTNPLSVQEVAALRFSDIEVETGDTFAARSGAEYQGRLENDLESKLRSAFADRIDPAGRPLTVSVDRLEIADSGSTAFGFGQSSINGTVKVLPAGATEPVLYSVRASTGQRSGNLLGAVISSAVESKDGYYNDLISGFATRARAKVIN